MGRDAKGGNERSGWVRMALRVLAGSTLRPGDSAPIVAPSHGSQQTSLRPTAHN